jgi:hypothetical protein
LDRVPEARWLPILEGDAAELAAAAVTAIADAMGGELWAHGELGPSLAAGDAGVALFFEYLDRARPGAGFREKALEHLDLAIDAMASSNLDPGLYSGFTGVAWVAEHLYGRSEGLETPLHGNGVDEDPNAVVDAAVLGRLGRTPWTYHFDLIGGLTGYAVYALERLPHLPAAECLELVVERLSEIAQPHPMGLAWYTSPDLLPEPNRPSFPQGLNNLGLAHGTPGVIAVLARICTAGVATEKATQLMAAAVSWLLSQKLSTHETSVFPYEVGPVPRLRPARTAWCYGDPGIAVALLAAGRAMGDEETEKHALALAHAVAQRPAESTGVRDAGLCHGAAGLGHLLNRLYHATGDPALLDSARGWFTRTLQYWEPGRGIGGFLAFAPPDDDFDRLIWRESPGFLIGSVGMGLALLAATSDVEPTWDRVLLASPIPGEAASLPSAG